MCRTLPRAGAESGHRAAGTAELPQGRSVATAAFSPDGRFLAVEVSLSSEADDGGQAVQLELVSMASGRLTVVPGTWLSSDALVSFG